MLMRRRPAQSTVEYAVLAAVVVGALLVMQIYMKRGFSGKLKDSTDRVGSQFTPGTATYTVTQKSDGARSDETAATGYSKGVITSESQTRGGHEEPSNEVITGKGLWDK